MQMCCSSRSRGEGLTCLKRIDNDFDFCRVGGLKSAIQLRGWGGGVATLREFTTFQVFLRCVSAMCSVSVDDLGKKV